MDTSNWSSRLVPALAVTAVCIAAVGAVGHRLSATTQPAPQRPAADAPVNVVKAPAAPAAAPGTCTTCAMGAGRSTL